MSILILVFLKRACLITDSMGAPRMGSASKLNVHSSRSNL